MICVDRLVVLINKLSHLNGREVDNLPLNSMVGFCTRGSALFLRLASFKGSEPFRQS
jgi:hypothetical protein